MTPTVGEINQQIREALTGPNTLAIVEQEQAVLYDHRRRAGWERAAQLHAEVLVDQVGSVCRECTRIIERYEGSPPGTTASVEWPCVTAVALGLAP